MGQPKTFILMSVLLFTQNAFFQNALAQIPAECAQLFAQEIYTHKLGTLDYTPMVTEKDRTNLSVDYGGTRVQITAREGGAGYTILENEFGVSSNILLNAACQIEKIQSPSGLSYEKVACEAFIKQNMQIDRALEQLPLLRKQRAELYSNLGKPKKSSPSILRNKIKEIDLDISKHQNAFNDRRPEVIQFEKNYYGDQPRASVNTPQRLCGLKGWTALATSSTGETSSPQAGGAR